MRFAAVFLALALLTAVATPAAAARPTLDYVALGDSYASGPGIPNQTGLPPGCGRSDHNYPALLAGWLRTTTFTDVTCGGATTVHMTSPQNVTGGPHQPQFDALSKKTDLVTLTIGGNDIGFGEILARCGQAGATDPLGAPCKAYYTQSGTDVLADRIAATAPKVAAVLAGIKERSPHAKILVVGYLRILPAEVGCWPSMPFAAGDTPYFDATERALNTAIGEVTRAAGARFVNPYPASTNHDACQPPERRWVEPLRPASPAAPVHPNLKGMTAVAALTWLAAHLPR